MVDSGLFPFEAWLSWMDLSPRKKTVLDLLGEINVHLQRKIRSLRDRSGWKNCLAHSNVPHLLAERFKEISAAESAV